MSVTRRPLLRYGLSGIHDKVGSPDADGGRRGFETGLLGRKLSAEAREVGHGSLGESNQQAELPFGGREEEVPQDEAAGRPEREGGSVPEDEAERSVGARAESVPGVKLGPGRRRKNVPPTGDGRRTRGVADHPDGPVGVGVPPRRRRYGRQENRDEQDVPHGLPPKVGCPPSFLVPPPLAYF